MRAYPVPVQLDQEEKVIGGYLTLRQLLYLILGAVIGCGTALTFNLPLIAKLIIAAGGLTIGIILAFIPAEKTTLDIYLLRWIMWTIKKRKYYLGGDS